MKKPNRIRPVSCVWTGEHFVPLPRFRRLCDQQFVVDEEYPLIPSEERSMDRHNGYFAQVKEAWINLSEEFDGRFPTEKHLRSWALVQTGYCSESNYVMDSDKDAKQMAVALRIASPYSVIRVSGNVCQCFEPHSQSKRSMRKEAFDASSKAVLDLVSSMARTTPSDLRKNAGRSA